MAVQASIHHLVSARRRRRGPLAAAAAALAVASTAAVAPAAASAAEPPQADLSVALTHSPSTAKNGVELTLSLTVSNAGPDPAVAAVAAVSFEFPLQTVRLPSACRTTASGAAVCTAGDLAAGASQTFDIVVVPQYSGLFVLPAAVSSDTADPDAADRSTTDSVVVVPGPTIGERYVRGVLPTVLGRPASSADASYWGSRFQQAWRTGNPPMAKVPSSWIASDEYRRLRIREAYRRILDRAANPSDLAYWVPRLRAGLPYDAFERRLFASREFAVAHPPVGTPVVALYQDILGRNPSDAEASAAVHDLYGRRVTLAGLAYRLQHSNEGEDRLIDGFYQQAVGHAPSGLARYGWKLDLHKGVSPEALWAHLLVGSEVMSRYRPTSDDYGYGPEYLRFSSAALPASA